MLVTIKLSCNINRWLESHMENDYIYKELQFETSQDMTKLFLQIFITHTTTFELIWRIFFLFESPIYKQAQTIIII